MQDSVWTVGSRKGSRVQEGVWDVGSGRGLRTGAGAMSVGRGSIYFRWSLSTPLQEGVKVLGVGMCLCALPLSVPCTQPMAAVGGASCRQEQRTQAVSRLHHSADGGMQIKYFGNANEPGI